MRPSDITDGIAERIVADFTGGSRCFNEAVGYYRRNRGFQGVRRAHGPEAAMRPSDITDGIFC